MDPQIFHEIDENLTSGDVDQLKFLCLDFIPKRRLESVTDAKDLILRLDEQGLLEDELLFPELLITIGRIDLLEILKKSKEEVKRNLLRCDNSRKGVSAYRKMLLKISEDMTEENFRAAKFLLDLPRAKLGRSTSFLDTLIEMEKQQRLGPDNLDELYRILEKCDKQLAVMIERFRNQSHRDQEQVGGRLPLEEVFLNNPVSETMERERRRNSSAGTITTDAETPLNPNEYYILTQRPLGYCLIINNYNFLKSTNLLKRTGTDMDKDRLAKLFSRMHFQIEVRSDLEAWAIKDEIKQFANKNHASMGAFVCCILSHGEKGTVLGTDGKPVEIREVTLPFAGCRTLASKPKLFFIQACQGDENQAGVWTSDGREDAPEEDEKYEEDAGIIVLRKIPIEADFLIGMATVEHYLSYRHTKEGSIFIQELCKKMEELCPKKEDMLSILTKVNFEVSKRILKGYKQMPEPRYTLTKKLVLPID
nr:caspase-8 isoform X1 [Danio rerio]|eukprot:XP_005165894.1 caspase-8 isoform X1 [Danio rerio]